MRFFLFLIVTFVHLLASNAFITPDELKNDFGREDVVLLDVSPKEVYKAGHIKNALHVTLSDFTDMEKPWLLAPLEKRESTLKNLGIDSNSTVVIYSHNGENSLLRTSFLAFVLLEGGFENVSILEGGYMAWVFEYEFLVTSEFAFALHKGDVKLKKTDIIVDMDFLKNTTSSVTLLDARSPMEYFGVEKSKDIQAIGHIPHAKSSHYKDKFLRDGLLRDEKEIAQIYVQGHGLQPDDAIVVYADTIFAASMEWYILYKHLNFKNTKMYEKSFMEWGNENNTSVTRFKWE